MHKDKQLIASQIGECVHIARRRNKISQEKLAELTGVSRNFIGMVERGENIPSIYILYKIAHSLNLKLNELIAITQV